MFIRIGQDRNSGSRRGVVLVLVVVRVQGVVDATGEERGGHWEGGGTDRGDDVCCCGGRIGWPSRAQRHPTCQHAN